ncbi:MAG: PDDEXK nuclease domain-containing protein [Bacteroidales bacterium]|nr:PDDEXK nuclease domain-containing protein [Bacteroidales bacterium]
MEDKNLNIYKEISLFESVSNLIDESRKQVATAVNTTMVYTYYGIGHYIVEFEQGGTKRAEYGKGLLKRLSERLTERYGKGWSVDTLEKTRTFYNTYSISATVQRKSEKEKSATVQRIFNVDENDLPKFVLTWNHYQILMRIDNLQERNFYEFEAASQTWSVRQLQRQVASSLYERLALSRNKEEVIRLANEGQTFEKPADIIKNPLVLEFVGLKPDESYSETDLESAIINKLQPFLLEMGKGFLFEARQKRFTFDEDNFYVDLVLYNRLLQSYVLIDLKTSKLTHQDLGQMQMYVNYFDRYVKKDFEKPTIGILLCKTKSDTLVELTLPKDTNIYAQQYALCLPDKETLRRKLTEWTDEYEQLHETM